MNILILCSKLDLSGDKPWLTNELIEQFRKEEDTVDVCFFDWSGQSINHVIDNDKGRIVVVNNPNKFGKVFKWFLSPIITTFRFLLAIKRDKYDLIIHFSPAVTLGLANVIFKLKYSCPSLFILWDFFPYHHYQIGLVPRYLMPLFSLLEKLYINNSDYIGLMSKKNEEYFNEKYPFYSGAKIGIPIWGGGDAYESNELDLCRIRAKYCIGEHDFVCVFGGQLEPGRGLDFILDVKCKINRDEIKFIILGDGTLKNHIKNRIINDEIGNVDLYDSVPRDEYLTLLSASHVGIVATVSGVDVPTFPSKTIDYFRCSKPIIAIVEESTDYGSFIKDIARAGFSYTHNEIDSVVEGIIGFCDDRELCSRLGGNGLNYYRKNFSVGSITCKIKSEIIK